MLLALVGVTGVGKSYYKEIISKELGFEKVSTIRTRAMRPGEENGKSGIFMTEDELNNLKKENKIAYDFNVFGGRYAYLKDEVLSNKNMVFEMHYTMIDDWKKIRPDIQTIYIFPSDIEIPKQKAKERNLSKDKETERIKEIEEQYTLMKSDKKLQNKYDVIFYNNYDEASESNLLDIINQIMKNQ